MKQYMKTITMNGELELYSGGRLIFIDLENHQNYTIKDDIFKKMYYKIPAEDWVGGTLIQTSSNVTLECETENDTIRNIYKASIPIYSAENFKFKLVEISSDEEKFTISYIRGENDLD